MLLSLVLLQHQTPGCHPAWEWSAKYHSTHLYLKTAIKINCFVSRSYVSIIIIIVTVFNIIVILFLFMAYAAHSLVSIIQSSSKAVSAGSTPKWLRLHVDMNRLDYVKFFSPRGLVVKPLPALDPLCGLSVLSVHPECQQGSDKE